MTKEMPVEQNQRIAGGQGVGAAPRPSAKTVADQFVNQFYKVLERHPRYLHRFYDKTSTLTVSETGEDGREVVVTAHDQEAIHDRLMDFFSEATARCESVSPQASAGDGILLLVMGQLSRKGKPDCLFSQTLFLAVQTKGFFVLNDIIRLTPIKRVGKAAPQSVHTQEVAIPVRRKREGDRWDSDHGSSPGTPARRDCPPYTGSHAQPAGSPELDAAKEAAPPPHTSPPTQPNHAQRSPTVAPIDPPGGAQEPEAEPHKSALQNFCDAAAADLARQRTSSIFVRGIPDGADARALAGVFSQFGRLREGGVTIKQGRRDRFAFVEFDSVAELEGVLGGDVRVCGQPVVVEEKRPMVIRRPGRVKRSLSGQSAHSRDVSLVSSPGYVGSPCAARPFHLHPMGPHPLPYVIPM